MTASVETLRSHVSGTAERDICATRDQAVLSEPGDLHEQRTDDGDAAGARKGRRLSGGTRWTDESSEGAHYAPKLVSATYKHRRILRTLQLRGLTGVDPIIFQKGRGEPERSRGKASVLGLGDKESKM